MPFSTAGKTPSVKGCGDLLFGGFFEMQVNQG
jgi:hypothetical protein